MSKIIKKTIFIDTDMGNDDIMAISMLLLSPIVNIKGISLVNGVSSVNKGFNNLSEILDYYNIDIPIAKGSRKAIVETRAKFPLRDRLRAENLSLLSSLPLNSKEKLLSQTLSVEDFIFEKTSDKETSLITLGPLTNIAKTIIKYKVRFTRNLKEIIIMGGGINKGNIPPLNISEYNIFLDPEAAGIVFNSGTKITMIGIDAAKKIPATKIFTRRVEKINPKNKMGKIIREIIINNDRDFDYFYDPLAISVFLNKEVIIKRIRCGIEVLLKNSNRGKTIVNKSMTKNVNVIQEINSNKFYKSISELITT